MPKILFVGESWTIHMIHMKGFDSFTTTKYEEGAHFLLNSLRSAGVEVEYMPCHVAHDHFPSSLEELQKYDAVILSDIGSNTLSLPNATFYSSRRQSNRMEMIQEYVDYGKGFMMVGGYMSFSGIEGKARYKDTPIEKILPVTMLSGDDRVELPQGAVPVVVQADHPILTGIPEQWPFFLGYNKLVAKKDAQVLLTIQGDPFIVTGNYGKGRTMAFASDCAPHWGPPEFLNWEGYTKFWVHCVKWLAGQL
ncbi:glutamine amidotransferase [Desulforamulus putei]|uniref:Uncharacterized membrane protein n=1 Tax=Desulforamulus putei DSM 12395 TaxID=1121429 RepID=A0A1M5CHU5_9FIRM|nr:glutamine amidotransferase [Desulforamulus putei]SHF53982.1 Uncharacterized membrane protein [Desulforamulus putei DSM 12395]